MKIYLDAMGGDNAPMAPVEGALEALGLYPQLEIELAGPIEEVQKTVDTVFANAAELRKRITLTDCPEIITNNEAPVMAVRRKKQSAIVDGMLKLRGGMFRLGRLKGIDRPALAPLLPNGKDFFLLIDCGANVDCRPEYLHQFAMMGSAYMESMRGVKTPRIGLVNNGAEAEKGCALTKEAYELLGADKRLNFVGNVEAREITNDVADVIVCDGFVGNVILKFMEGVAGTLMGIIKKEIYGDFRSKIGGLLAKPAFRRVKKAMDYNEVGGAPLLGVRGNVIKAHGSCKGHAMACAIRQAVQMVEGNVVGKIEALLPKDEPAAE